MNRIYAREEVCMGCKLCEIHCIVAHSAYPKNIVKAFKKNPRPVSRVVVEENRPVSFALQCRHCEEAFCVKSCITGAMYKDPKSGAVLNDPDRCVGCWTCVVACPFGAIARDDGDKKAVAKCDLCVDKGEPACVANCPNDALILGKVK